MPSKPNETQLRMAELLKQRPAGMMCGRPVQMHGISLVVDHKKPRDWGGANDRENLWAICEECNGGKKSYFSSLSVDAEFMKKVTAHESVHVRIGETLKAVGIGKRTPPEILDVAPQLVASY